VRAPRKDPSSLHRWLGVASVLIVLAVVLAMLAVGILRLR